MDNVDVRSLKSWMEYIAKDYREKGIVIDAVKLYDETQRKEQL